MVILGVNAYHGDASAVVIRDGELVAAVEEERLRRIKHWAGFPREAIRKCLDMAGVAPMEVSHVAVSRNPRANLVRKAVFALLTRPSLGLVRDRVRNSQRVRELNRALAEALDVDPDLMRVRTHSVEHHPAHLASAFFLSPFDEAAVCAIDGFGDFVSTSIGSVGDTARVLDVYFPHSLGLMYLAITQYLGSASTVTSTR